MMPKVTTETTIGRTCVELEAEAYEHEAKAATLRAEAVRARAMELHRQHAPSIAKAPVHMTRGEYAQRSRVSDATVSRWAKQGMPTIPVGTTDRIDPAGADEWRRSRPRVATTPTKKTLAANDDALDVSASLSSAGIERGHAS